MIHELASRVLAVKQGGQGGQRAMTALAGQPRPHRQHTFRYPRFRLAGKTLQDPVHLITVGIPHFDAWNK
jgi:hypothetical protein